MYICPSCGLELHKAYYSDIAKCSRCEDNYNINNLEEFEDVEFEELCHGLELIEREFNKKQVGLILDYFKPFVSSYKIKDISTKNLYENFEDLTLSDFEIDEEFSDFIIKEYSSGEIYVEKGQSWQRGCLVFCDGRNMLYEFIN